jgi:hypothetical protein
VVCVQALLETCQPYSDVMKHSPEWQADAGARRVPRSAPDVGRHPSVCLRDAAWPQAGRRSEAHPAVCREGEIYKSDLIYHLYFFTLETVRALGVPG